MVLDIAVIEKPSKRHEGGENDDMTVTDAEIEKFVETYEDTSEIILNLFRHHETTTDRQL